MELNFTMTPVDDQTLTGEVSLQGKHFTRCVFTDAMLVYEGGAPPQFTDCVFQRFQIALSGQPVLTLEFLRMLLQPGSGLEAAAEQLLGIDPQANVAATKH